MRKLILVSLCVLFMAGTALGYTVSGTVFYSGGGTVPNPIITLTATSPTGGGASYTFTGNANGTYSGGWSETNCVGWTINVKAKNQAATSMGSKQWVAQSNNESGKNVTIYPVVAPVNPDLWLGAGGGAFAGPGPQITSPVYAFAYSGGKSASAYSAELAYDTSKMTCDAAGPIWPFDSFFDVTIDPAGTLTVSAQSSAGSVPLGDVNTPTTLFEVIWNVQDFNTPGLITNVVTLENSEFTLDPPDSNNRPIANSTEYVIGEPNEDCKPYFRIADQEEWEEALLKGHVYPMELEDWESYMEQWQAFVVEGNSHPNDPFLPAEPPTGGLYVYEGNDVNPNEPNDAGLVMGWGDPCDPNGSFSSAWKFDHLKDPVYTNCIIQLAVTAPQIGLNGQINNVDFGLQNIPIPGGPIRSWTWNCGPAGSGAPITWGVPTRITIDTTKVGVGAATPTASAYMNNPAFNLNNVQCLIVSENGAWVGGPNPAPAPGNFQFLWNYWHWILVSPKTTLSKEIYKKWSQPPVVIDTNHPPILLGWNEYSDFNDPCIVADDFNCADDRPITDVHWWGSFIGWNNPWRPPLLPQAFHLGIWTNVPDSNLADPCTFSYPDLLIWENYCDNYVWNFAGYDYDPRSDMAAAGTIEEPCKPPTDYEPNEACFQFTQLLSEDEWFYQEPNENDPNGTVYWLSIAPIWGPNDYTDPNFYPWGWKTRPHYFEDDAVSMQPASWKPPIVGLTAWAGIGIPIQFPAYPDPDSHTWDMAFELTTNQPVYEDEPIPGDLNADKIVNLRDLAIMANNWLVIAP